MNYLRRMPRPRADVAGEWCRDSGRNIVRISLRRLDPLVHSVYVPKQGIEILGLWLHNIAIGVRGLGKVERCEHAGDGQPEVRFDEVCSRTSPTVVTHRER